MSQVFPNIFLWELINAWIKWVESQGLRIPFKYFAKLRIIHYYFDINITQDKNIFTHVQFIILVIIDDFMQLYEVWVQKFLHNCNFHLHILQLVFICHASFLLAIIFTFSLQLWLRKYLHCLKSYVYFTMNFNVYI
jgi:hypothetical protein